MESGEMFDPEGGLPERHGSGRREFPAGNLNRGRVSYKNRESNERRRFRIAGNRRRPGQTGDKRMAYVVTENCIKCKYTDCVDVCPVDCFREGPNFLVIDPDECIDCSLCVPECPAEAIFAEDDLPDEQKQYTALNAELAKIWKPIIEVKSPLPDADDWAQVKNKLDQLER